MAKKKLYGRATQTKPKRSPRIWLWVLLGLILIGAGITALRWRAWFGNSPEEPYRTPNQIDRVTLTAGEHFQSERTVSWRCGESLQDSWLEYAVGSSQDTLQAKEWIALPAEGTLVETRSGKGCYYTAKIHGLQAGQSYCYRVSTGALRSDVFDFSVSASLDTVSRLIYLGDVQDPMGEVSTKLFSSLKKLNDSIPQDAILAAGDQIEGATDVYWRVWYDAIPQQWQASMPMLFSTGNHEYIKRGFARELDPRWVHQYNYPSNGPEGYHGRTYYVDMPMVRLIFLDTTPLTLFNAWGTRAWLQTALRSSSQPWQIVVFHHAVRSVRQGRSNPLMQYLFKPVLQDGGADLVLQGHDHAYSRITTKGEDNELLSPVYVVSTSSPKMYRNEFSLMHDRLASGMQLYQTLELTKSAIRYRAYQLGGELYDDVEILHAQAPDMPHIVVDYAGEWPERFLYDGFGANSKGQKRAEQYRQSIATRRKAKAPLK